MPIIADLDDLAPAEFLLMLSLNRKTGKLTGTKDDDKVMVAFRNGSIVYAASTSVRERIGSLLVGRGLVSEDDVQEAIRQQESSEEVRHLGNILVDMGVITFDALAEVVRSQFQRIVGELLSWDHGVLSFERTEIPDLGAVHVSPREILVDMGFETEELVLGGLTELEDSERDRREQDTAVVRSMMQEMERLSPSLTAETTLEILRAAAERVRRGVLVLVTPGGLMGAGGFGVGREGDRPEPVVRQFSIGRDKRTVLERVIRDRRPYRGPMPDTPGNRSIVEQLGGIPPGEVVVVPLIVRERVVALLYGDNAPEYGPLRGMEGLVGELDDVARSLERREE